MYVYEGKKYEKNMCLSTYMKNSYREYDDVKENPRTYIHQMEVVYLGLT